MKFTVYGMGIGFLIASFYQMCNDQSPEIEQPNLCQSKYVRFVDSSEVVSYKPIVFDKVIVVERGDSTGSDSIYFYKICQ